MQENLQKEEAFLKEKFREYYSKHKVTSVPEIDKREFGIGDFGKKIVRRHMSFSDYAELNSFLRNEAPFFISYSAAYYKDASARPMEKKGLLGADLIYEFDAGDFHTACKEKHDFWICPKCNNTGKGPVTKCPKCFTTVKQYEFPCEHCIEETKKQVIKLLNILESELGLVDGISINFSGNAGYHVHIRSDTIRHLSQDARIELVDYLTLSGFVPEHNGFNLSTKMLTCPKYAELKGAQARVMQHMIRFIMNANNDELAQYGCISLPSSRKREGWRLASYIYENKESVVARLKEGTLFYIGSRTIASAFWKAIIEHAVRLASIKLDRQTSIDIHKIVRVPDTLHGSSGLIAKTVSLDELKDFNPFEHALAFNGGQIKVFINKAPEFKIADDTFGPFENERAELPTAAAIYLIAKGVAKLCD
jgi:DNA primase small subunit